MCNNREFVKDFARITIYDTFKTLFDSVRTSYAFYVPSKHVCIIVANFEVNFKRHHK